MNRSTALGAPDGTQALRDLEQVRSYLAGGGPSALFDLPWIPLYVGICYSFHPLIGAMAVGGCVALALITVLADLSARSPSRALAHHAGVRNTLAETGRRNAQTLAAMGMTAAHADRWIKANRAYVRAAGRSLAAPHQESYLQEVTACAPAAEFAPADLGGAPALTTTVLATSAGPVTLTAVLGAPTGFFYDSYTQTTVTTTTTEKHLDEHHLVASLNEVDTNSTTSTQIYDAASGKPVGDPVAGAISSTSSTFLSGSELDARYHPHP